MVGRWFPGQAALAFALRFADSVRNERPEFIRPPQHLTVEEAPPEHVGLGVGTQLGLAVARVLAEAWGLVLDAPDLARRRRSGAALGIGVHGFAQAAFWWSPASAATRPVWPR